MSQYRDPRGQWMPEKIVRDLAILAVVAILFSTRVQNDVLATNKDVFELRRIEVERTKAEKWNGQLPMNVYAGAPIPFFNPQGKNE